MVALTALAALAALAAVGGALALAIGTSGGPPVSAVHRPARRLPTASPPAPVRVPAWAADQAFGASMYFLSHYELPSGRVVRWDQGARHGQRG